MLKLSALFHYRSLSQVKVVALFVKHWFKRNIKHLCQILTLSLGIIQQPWQITWAPVSKPSPLVQKKTIWPITSCEATAKQRRWKWVPFSLPLNADINQTALKRRMTRLIPRGTQEPLCKVRQLGETEHVCIWLKTLLAVCCHCMSLLMGADMCCLDL